MSLDAKKHWIVLRATAVAALPLCFWFVFSVVHLAGADYRAFTAWLGHPFNALMMIIFIVLTFYHAALGCHEIIEDYVHAEPAKTLSLKIKGWAFLIVAAVCILSVLKVAFL
jgi:succinate dehydrogenase / fumarate reductase membrane anchor subunit